MAEPLRSGRVFSAPHVAGYWAKARAAIDGGPVWHPLAYHCPDVAAAADRLLANSPRRLEPLAGLAQTSPAALHGLFVLLIALHDIGKFSRRFQAKSDQAWPSGTVAAMPIQMLAMTRSGSPCGTRSSRSSAYFDEPHEDGRALWAAITGHHGRPVDRGDAGLHWRAGFPPYVRADLRALVSDMAA